MHCLRALREGTAQSRPSRARQSSRTGLTRKNAPAVQPAWPNVPRQAIKKALERMWLFLEEKLEYTPGPVVRKTGQLYDNSEKEVGKISSPSDGREVTAVKGMSVLEAARLAGIRIPACVIYGILMKPAPARFCLVEVEVKGTKRCRPPAFILLPEGLVVPHHLTPGAAGAKDDNWNCCFPTTTRSVPPASGTLTASCRI